MKNEDFTTFKITVEKGDLEILYLCAKKNNLKPEELAGGMIAFCLGHYEDFKYCQMERDPEVFITLKNDKMISHTELCKNLGIKE